CCGAALRCSLARRRTPRIASRRHSRHAYEVLPMLSRIAAPIIAGACLLALGQAQAQTPRAEQPNILWLTSEDHGPHMGCYGDRVATTPNIDRLAARGMVYTRVWSNAPVCAPARTTLITGMYAPSTGSEHMRSMVPAPAGIVTFPHLLR